jgi:hypothetical protein
MVKSPYESSIGGFEGFLNLRVLVGRHSNYASE